MGVGVADEWWLDCVLPPWDVDPDAQPPDPDEDRWSHDDDSDSDVASLAWELPPLVEAAEPPVPWPGSSMIIVGSEVLVQPGVRARDDDTAPIPLEHSWVEGLSSVELVDALRDLQRARSWVDGLTQQAMARVADLDATEDMWSREEVGAALRMSSLGAGNKMADAQTLCRDLPLTLESLLSGRITSGHANAVVETAACSPTIWRANWRTRC